MKWGGGEDFLISRDSVSFSVSWNVSFVTTAISIVKKLQHTSVQGRNSSPAFTTCEYSIQVRELTLVHASHLSYTQLNVFN